MVELADTQDLGSCTARCEGSTPFSGTESRLGVPVLGPVVRHWGDADTVQTVRDFA